MFIQSMSSQGDGNAPSFSARPWWRVQDRGQTRFHVCPLVRADPTRWLRGSSSESGRAEFGAEAFGSGLGRPQSRVGKKPCLHILFARQIRCPSPSLLLWSFTTVLKPDACTIYHISLICSTTGMAFVFFLPPCPATSPGSWESPAAVHILISSKPLPSSLLVSSLAAGPRRRGRATTQAHIRSGPVCFGFGQRRPPWRRQRILLLRLRLCQTRYPVSQDTGLPPPAQLEVALTSSFTQGMYLSASVSARGGLPCGGSGFFCSDSVFARCGTRFRRTLDFRLRPNWRWP